MPLEPIDRPRPVAIRIADQLRASIESGEFPVGTRLPSEAELAQTFGVSRPSVREALGALQFVGFVDSVRGSGSHVVSQNPTLAAVPDPGQGGLLSAQEALELFEARLLLEPRAAWLAAQSPVRDKVEDASSLVEGMRLVVHDEALHADTDLRIHRAVLAICPNVRLRDYVGSLLDLAASPALASVRSRAWTDPEVPPAWGDQHADVLRAIEGRDPEAAHAAAWTHLASSTRNALHLLRDDVDAETVDRLGAVLDAAPPPQLHERRPAAPDRAGDIDRRARG